MHKSSTSTLFDPNGTEPLLASLATPVLNLEFLPNWRLGDAHSYLARNCLHNKSLTALVIFLIFIYYKQQNRLKDITQ